MAEVAAAVLTLDESRRLLATDPAAAESRARKILDSAPADPGALQLLGAALKRQRRYQEARDVLEFLAASQPDLVTANFELGLLLAEMGERQRAILHFGAAVAFNVRFWEAWFALADQLSLLDSPATNPLREVRGALRLGRRADAADMAAQVVLREPDHAAARFLHASLLLSLERPGAAVIETGRLVESDPDNESYRALHASALHANEDFAREAVEYEALLKLAPDRAGNWMSYGRVLRALGRSDEAVAAFRRVIAILPVFGDPWRVLAGVSGFRFEAAEVERMRELLARNDLRPTNRTQLLYALAKAEEGAGNYAEAFAHYQASNSLQKANNPFNADWPTAFVRRSKAIYSPQFLGSRAGAGSQAREPIFVLGLPRSGTTLVEQIISSHPLVEGMEELAFLGMTAGRIAEAREGETIDAYLGRVPMIPRERFRELGEHYLGLVRSRRKTTLPFFTDKLPSNFLHVGLAQLILPNARIVDVRRNPLDCCMACFTSYFVFPQPWAHDLSDVGRYYADYVELMNHYDRVLPGRIHRVIYDDLVRSPEIEIRRLLDALGLPFDERCLRSHENERSVRTLSAEQVRRPITAEGLGRSRRYDPWLGPLKAALGEALESWRGGRGS
ncbi:MAG TPA: sulfotransferase [Rhizomicrobium sp.]|nr:sulfotransferase [Rhizomicrobium sp.]